MQDIESVLPGSPWVARSPGDSSGRLRGPPWWGGLLPAELTTRYDHVLEEHVELGCRHRSHRSRKCRRPARMPAIKKMIRNIPELCGTSGTCASCGHHDLQNAPRGGVELGVGAVAMVVGQTRKSSSPWSQGAIPTDPGSSLSLGVAGVGPRICGRSPKSSRDGFGGPGLGGPCATDPCCQSGLRSVEFQDGSRIVPEYSGSKFLRTVPSTS